VTSLVLRSRLLIDAGFRHGFSLRTGGVSEGPFASLNLGRSVGDDPARVEENYRRFIGAIEVSEIFEASQVHGRAVAVVDGAEVREIRAREADALIARSAAVGVRTADCIPILIGDVRTGAVAAVHAGWRGVTLRVLDAALDALGGRPEDLVAAIGPHIRPDAFEVGDDVAAQIAAAAHGEEVVRTGSAKPHVDLARAVRAQLAHRGVGRVDDVGGCTLTEAERFFSHRRDAGKTGRHLAGIAAKG
jgi:YfiH family protein